ncbi:MAG: hypothetical protein RBR16_00490 [Syntrophus sp. (in: bacteria)]|nr:hypothetical protein [Syntrophus sp. (in: bacteria)]
MPNEKLKIVQKDGEYTRSFETFSDADLIAYSVHAALYSGGGKSLHKDVQQNLNMDTTAVAVTKDCLYFAFNGISLEARNFLGLKFDKPLTDRKTGGVKDQDLYFIQNIPLDYNKSKTEYCGAMPDPPQVRQGSTVIIYSPRPTQMRVAAAAYVELSGNKQAHEIKLITVTRTLTIGKNEYKDIDVEYLPGKGVLKTTYQLKASGKEAKSSTLRYDPVSIVKEILSTLWLNDDIRAMPRKAVLLKNKKNDPAAHAEMQLLNYFQRGKIDLREIRTLGVSKTCCHKCADRLEKEKIHYSAWSEVHQQGDWWKAPESILQVPEAVPMNF